MKNVMKTATLESKFPLLAVENGCIISKDEQVLALESLELRAAPNPLVDIENSLPM